jgi:hypothetical protein
MLTTTKWLIVNFKRDRENNEYKRRS